MFLPVLMLKLLLISPGHIYFVSLEFLHICTPLTPQTSTCDSHWHCELLGYMKADESGWPCPISLWGTLSISKIHLSVPWTPYDRVMLVSAISVLFPKHTANCGSIAFLGFLWWQLWKLLSLWGTGQKGRDRRDCNHDPQKTVNANCLGLWIWVLHCWSQVNQPDLPF